MAVSLFDEKISEKILLHLNIGKSSNISQLYGLGYFGLVMNVIKVIVIKKLEKICKDNEVLRYLRLMEPQELIALYKALDDIKKLLGKDFKMSLRMYKDIEGWQEPIIEISFPRIYDFKEVLSLWENTRRIFNKTLSDLLEKNIASKFRIKFIRE